MGRKTDSPDRSTLNLRFPPGSPSGFTPSGIAGFSDLKPAAVVRELIQNSLDAATEANEATAVVRFHLTRRKIRDLPGIEAYTKAFEAAVRTHKEFGRGSLPSQAKRVVQVIREAVKATEQDVLAVLDNGIGLDESRMSALLSDGVSAKTSSATGTFGNGHTVAIPASNLRYVLYGGVTVSGSRIGAGHAVIASSIDREKRDKYPTSADGFLVRGFSAGSHVFGNGDSLPALIADLLDNIEEEWKHGSAIIITAFNHFRNHRHSLWTMVSKAAACNFFQAIDDNRLVVEVEDYRRSKHIGKQLLNRSTLRAVLEQHSSEKRSMAFLGGHRAYNAYEVYKYGTKHTIDTELGTIEARVRVHSSGSTRVDLCRNGMWITNQHTIPNFYYAFQDRKPFSALLLLNSDSGGRLYELVRNAEGPLHDKLDVRQRLLKPEAKDLREAFNQIKDRLKAVVPEVGSDNYSPDDFLALDFGGDGTGGKSQRSFWGMPQKVTRREPSSAGRGWRLGPRSRKGKRGRSSKQFQSVPVLRPLFQAASVPLGSKRRRIHLQSKERFNEAELRLSIDENLDATCDPLGLNDRQAVHISRVWVSGQELAGEQLVRQNARVVGVRLGDVEANSSLEVDIQYELSDTFPLLPGQEPVLRVDVLSSPATGGTKK